MVNDAGRCILEVRCRRERNGQSRQREFRISRGQQKCQCQVATRRVTGDDRFAGVALPVSSNQR